MRAFAVLSVAFALVLATATAGHGVDDSKDLIVTRRDGGKRIQCFIVTETLDKLTYTLGKGSKEVGAKWSDLVKVEYAEMRSGAWPTAVDARDRGKYEEAADLFNSVGDGGREWQHVYGAFAEGDSFELAGKYAAAAEAFAKLANYPKHRLWLDGTYRYGFCLALAKKETEALKVADELQAFGKKESVAQADVRANAIRAAVAAAKGDVTKLSENQGRARFSAVSEPEEWFHFAIFYADSLRRLGKVKDAAMEFRAITGQLENDPSKKAQASFGYGQCLVETDKQAALVELLKLDALPYGSPSQKCDARYLAGKLLWEEAKAGSGDAKAAAFHKANSKTARTLLTAAAESTANAEGKGKAKALLDSIGPDPDEKAEKDAKDVKGKPAADDEAAEAEEE
ncbi:MAG: hypothetical protein H0X45_04310 [Planctomycetes bacterium]|nr:hypothetical protein [Planctomycetota bacterium]